MHRVVGEAALLDDEQREHDRRGPTWAEPAEERDGRAARAGSEHRDGHRQHPNDREAEHRVQGDLPREVADRRSQKHGAEDDERGGSEDGSYLLEEVRDVAAALSPQGAEHAASHERRDEARAADRLGQAECEPGAGERHDLEPALVDEAAAARVDDDERRCGACDHSAEDSVPDLLENELHRVPMPDRALLGLRDREGDEEERDADPVVESALDVEALANADRKARHGHDRLAERRVGRREDDRDHERLRPAQRVQEGERGDEAEEDRERKPDPEQARRSPELAAQRAEVDPRGVGEEHDGERCLGQDLDLDSGGRGVDETERVRPDQETRSREHHRRGDRHPLDAAGDRREAEEDDRERCELPVHGSRSFAEPIAGTSLNLAAAGYGRSMSDPSSSSQERLDAEWIELLNEIRVLLPGVQVLFAFLLTAPFAAGFDKVTELQRDVYALALMGALASTVCLVAPTTHHRIRWRKRDKEFMLHVANRSVITGSAFLALSMSAAIFLVGDYLFDRWVAVLATDRCRPRRSPCSGSPCPLPAVCGTDA